MASLVSSSSRYGFAGTVAGVATASESELLAHLVRGDVGAGFRQIERRAIQAWERIVAELVRLCRDLQGRDPGFGCWEVVCEYHIPRRPKRIDVVLVTDFGIVVLEFKVGAEQFDANARCQVEDYALELAAFHSASRDPRIIPLLVATEAAIRLEIDDVRDTEQVLRVISCNAANLCATLLSIRARSSERMSIPHSPRWFDASYLPTPTIVEAAKCLYANHSVADLTRCSGDTQNLAATQIAILQIVESARTAPGEGGVFCHWRPWGRKDARGVECRDATSRPRTRGSHVYLSGNGPLVTVLTEALAKDAAKRTNSTLEAARRETGQFIQNVHRYIATEGSRSNAPSQRVAVFDEAQRAWNERKCEKEGRGAESEASAMLRILIATIGPFSSVSWEADRRFTMAKAVCENGDGGLRSGFGTGAFASPLAFCLATSGPSDRPCLNTGGTIFWWTSSMTSIYVFLNALIEVPHCPAGWS